VKLKGQLQSRQVLPWVVGTAFFVVALLASWRIVALRDSTIAAEKEEMASFLADQVSAWEDELIDDLNDALEAVAMEPRGLKQRQARFRKRNPWFNALYVWQTAEKPKGPSRPGRDAAFLYPKPRWEPVDRLVQNARCVARARWMQQDPSIDPIQVAAAFEVGCREEALSVRLFAAIEAAYLLDRTGQLHLALEALESAGVPDQLTVGEGAAQQIPPHLLANYRLMRGEMHIKLGEQQTGLDLLHRTGLEITALDAPDLAPTLHLVVFPIVDYLRRHGRQQDAERLMGLHTRARNRLVAYREIAERILPRPPRSDDKSRFIYDQYSDDPYLLYYGWPNELGVALQLEQEVLLADFLDDRRIRGRKRLVTITDASGAYVAGARRGGELAMVVPFGKTLTHLRVGVRQQAVDAEIARVDEQWLASLVVLLVCVLLGFGAMTVWVRAGMKQTELMDRQRAFTTRVTHELKTPLAGIRVMAENLEAGAFRDAEQRAEMARRIMDEADKLTQRVDEVLSVARERTIPDPVLFDVEEVLFEVIDQWGPRYEDAGVRLHAELDPTDGVKGDALALRDAVSCLVDNALKYRDEGRDDPGVWLVLRQEGRWVVIEVADNGMGVPKAMRRSIFERFVRVEGPNRGKAGGHGLGLHQVWEIVRAHKGSIVCEEGNDGGARFVMRLPATAS
jgi:signal transduction histidine kinase